MEHDLFDRVGFKFEYRKEMERFYRPFFSSNEELEQFFVEVFQLENKDLRPRQMINQICRFVTLANDIEQIRPGRDPLRILFLRICLESLCSLGQDWKRKSNLYKQFPMCISDEGAEYILNNFRYDFADPEVGVPLGLCGETIIPEHQLTLDNFFEIIRCVRNLVVHDGDYWSMQFFARDTDSVWLVDLTTDENIFKIDDFVKKRITYHFETTLLYEKFVFYFTDACIRFVQKYMGWLDRG